MINIATVSTIGYCTTKLTITALNDTCNKIYSNVSYFLTNDDQRKKFSSLTKLLLITDLENKIKIIKSMISEINEINTPLSPRQNNNFHAHTSPITNKFERERERDFDDSVSYASCSGSVYELSKTHETINQSLLALDETIKKISDILEEIKLLETEHKTKWFNYWRSIDITQQYSNIEQESKILDTRFKMFINVLSVFK